jgi:ubiquinone/menaquinone biosynthesis C-methylase UbiE
MEPTIKKDARLFARIPVGKLHVGDIVTFLQNKTVVAHRIIDIVPIEGKLHVLTKGDNNTLVDGWIPQRDILGVIDAIAEPLPPKRIISRLISVLPKPFQHYVRTYQRHHARWIAYNSQSFTSILLVFFVSTGALLLFEANNLSLLSLTAQLILLTFLLYNGYVLLRYGYYRRLTTFVSGKTVWEVRDHIIPFIPSRTVRAVYLPSEGITYSRVYAMSNRWAMFEELFPLFNHMQRPQNTLILGMGAGAVACQLIRSFPKTHVLGVDIDASILAIAKKYFLPLFKHYKNITLKQADAFDFVRTHKHTYDAIFVDIFHDAVLATHLARKQFITNLSRLRKDNGILIINFGIVHQTTMAPVINVYLAAHTHMKLFLMGKNIIGIVVAPSQRHLTALCGKAII